MSLRFLVLIYKNISAIAILCEEGGVLGISGSVIGDCRKLTWSGIWLAFRVVWLDLRMNWNGLVWEAAQHVTPYSIY